MGFWRLILALMVIASHTKDYEKLFEVNIGEVAVATFFFISGFLMPMSYSVHYQKSGPLRGAGTYFLNRFFRIYPIYWASILCILMIHLASYVLNGYVKVHYEAKTYLQNFLLIGLNQSQIWGEYLRFNNPAWSLDVELQYYLIAPILLLSATNYPNSRSILFASFGTLSCYFYFSPTGLVDIDRSFLSWGIFFLIGFAYYEALVMKKSINIIILSIILFSSLIYGALMERSLSEVVLIIFFIGFSAFLLTFQVDRRFGPCDQFAGNLSYPIYIFHIVFMGFIAILVDNTLIFHMNQIPRYYLTLFLHVLVSTVIGYLALKYIDHPVQNLRSRLG